MYGIKRAHSRAHTTKRTHKTPWLPADHRNTPYAHLAWSVIGHLSAPLRAHDLAERGVVRLKLEIVEGAAGAEGEDGVMLRHEHAVGVCVCG